MWGGQSRPASSRNLPFSIPIDDRSVNQLLGRQQKKPKTGKKVKEPPWSIHTKASLFDHLQAIAGKEASNQCFSSLLVTRYLFCRQTDRGRRELAMPVNSASYNFSREQRRQQHSAPFCKAPIWGCETPHTQYAAKHTIRGDKNRPPQDLRMDVSKPCQSPSLPIEGVVPFANELEVPHGTLCVLEIDKRKSLGNSLENDHCRQLAGADRC